MADQQTPDQELPEISPDELESFDGMEALEEIEPEEDPSAGETISLVETDDSPSSGTKIQTFGRGVGVEAKSDFRRPLNLTGAGATRCRMFHSKIAVGPMEYMQKQINDWIDGEDIEIKYVNQVVGILEGKRAEPAIIITVWY